MNDSLSELLKPKTKNEITYKVYAKATYYRSGLIKVFIPNVPYEKLMPNMELRENSSLYSGDDKNDKKTKTSIEDDLEKSLRRTKQSITDYVLNNDFELFCTFTFSPNKTPDRQDADRVKTQMGYWLKNQQVRYGKFDYLIIPELHMDRKSLHFHALFTGYKGILVDARKKINGRKAYNFKSYTLGFNSAVKIDNKDIVSSYVRKYIIKDMPQFHGKHRYWATKSLIKPRVEDNPGDWYKSQPPQRMYVSEYGRTLYFDARRKERNEG